MRVNDLVRFIKERERVRLNKEAGKPRPWTKDPILDKYRFCNVHREDDAVTRWLRQAYYPRFADNPDVWFAAVVARLLNNPEALDDIAIAHPCILSWKPASFRRILHARKLVGEKNFNAAYIVSTNGVAMDKVDYLVERVLGPLWANRNVMRPQQGPEWTLERYHARLMKFDGLGSFIAAQIIADLKYVDNCPLGQASDWSTFAASGPGSRRGLNRVVGQPPEKSWNEASWRFSLGQLQQQVNSKLDEPLHAQDLQNCLCEFDKYERARLGEGTPKQIYKEKVDD